MTKIMIFTPTWGNGPQPETLASIQTLEFRGDLVHEVSRFNPYPAPDARNVLAQFQRGRVLALEGEYDALLTIEHDMRVPPWAAQALWDAIHGPHAGVAYGVYLFRHGSNVLNAYQYLGMASRNMGESLSTRRCRTELDRALQAQIWPVSGVGFGCTMIRRDVLLRTPFRSGESGAEAPDIPFAMDCLRTGVRQVAHFGVLCGHYDNGRWLAALGAQEAGETTRVRALRNVVVRVGGGTKELLGGREYELPAYEVRELVRAGFVTA